MECVDVETILGVHIDREINNRTEYKESENMPGIGRWYMPKGLRYGNKLPYVMRVVIKVTTPVKLNIVNSECKYLINEEDKAAKRVTEVHFMQLEGI